MCGAISVSGLRVISSEKILEPPTPIDFMTLGPFYYFLLFNFPFSGKIKEFFGALFYS
jgi:hypothetical protein